MGAGKSTLAREIALNLGAIRLSEDEWLASVFPDEINDFADYIKYSARLKPLLKAHVQDLLKSGVSVVMDFPANTRKQRAWFREIFSEYQLPHRLIYLEADNEVCLKRLGLRREAQPERAKFDNEDVFNQVTSYFQPPAPDEGFNVEVVSQEHP